MHGWIGGKPALELSCGTREARVTCHASHLTLDAGNLLQAELMDLGRRHTSRRVRANQARVRARTIANAC